MDPNSANQRWSLWEWTVYPENLKRPPFQMVKENCARFGRKAFGSASEMLVRCRVDNKGLFWEIKVRTEGHPAHDPQYVQYMHAQWDRFLRNGFGQRAEITSHVRLEAGSREDGTPADQLIILPARIEPDGREP